MPPKKSKGQKISWGALMGDRRNADDLPTGPSGMPDQGRYGDRYGGGGGRYGDRGGDRYGGGGGGGRGGRDDTKWARGFDAGRDESGNDRYATRDQGPSRSEEAGQWRRNGGGGGGRFGGGGGGDRYGGGGGGGGRFGGGGDRYGGGGDRYGGGGRGYGGNDRYGGGGGGGYDDRPAHLRFGSRQQIPQREQPKKAEPKKEEKKDEKPVVHRVNQDLDDSLAGKTVVAVEELESTLQKKITNAEVVTMDDLINGLSKLAVDDNDTNAGFVDTMAKSLKAKTLTLEDSFRQIRGDVDDSLIANLTTEIILSLKTKMESEAVFTDFIRHSGVDIFPTICGKELKGEELEAFLTEKDLLCIKPVPDLSEHVSKALASGDSPDSILKHINSTVGETICVSNLGPVVLKAVLDKVLATKDKADTTAFDAFIPLLHRILHVPFDLAMQTECAFVAQVAWFEKGAVKKVMKELFPALHDKAIISAEAFMEWKEDTKKEKKSKMKTLLAISAWLQEIEPKEEYFDDEGDEGDEEDEDEYLQNPNLAF